MGKTSISTFGNDELSLIPGEAVSKSHGRSSVKDGHGSADHPRSSAFNDKQVKKTTSLIRCHSLRRRKLKYGKYTTHAFGQDVQTKSKNLLTARGRTFSVAWTCRAQHRAMNSCMIQFATKAEEDAAREEWFAGILERRQKKEEELAAVEKRRVEVIEMTRKQEEKERIEMEKKLAAQSKEKQEKKSSGSWWR